MTPITDTPAAACDDFPPYVNPYWRSRPEQTFSGRDAIIRGAADIDARTRYRAAAYVRADAFDITKTGGEDFDTPALRIEGQFYGLTDAGATALCDRLGLSTRHLDPALRDDTEHDKSPAQRTQRIIEMMSATLASPYGRAQMENTRIVVDEKAALVQGVVGRNYVHIPHTRLATGMTLHESRSHATVRGTAMRINNGRETPVVVRSKDNAADELRISCEGFNALAGESAFGLSTYIFRTVCLNGLTGLVNEARFRTPHVGRRKGLEETITRILDSSQACIEHSRNSVEDLMGVSLTPTTLANHRASCESLARVLDTLKANALANQLRTASRKEDSDRARECIHRMIDECGPPSARAVLTSPWRDKGHATGWDLVNLATAAARQMHDERTEAREQAERAAGTLGRTLITHRYALAP